MQEGIVPVTGNEGWTGCSGTGAKFPAIWTRGSAVLGSGCWRSRATNAPSAMSSAMAAALCSKFQCGGVVVVVVVVGLSCFLITGCG